MGSRVGSQSTGTLLGVLPASSAYTAIYTTPAIITPSDSAMVFLFWSMVFTPGTACLGYQMKFYRGPDLNGVLLPVTWNAVQVAGNSYVCCGGYVDSPGGGAVPYTLAISQTAATGAGTITDGGLIAFIL